MSLLHRVVLPLRVLLASVFGALVAAQVSALPAGLGHLTEASPELAPLRWPLLAIGLLVLACGQVVTACTWQLLTLVREDRIFSDGASAWVDVVLRGIAAAWALLAVALAAVVAAGGPAALAVLLLVLLLVAAAVGLLVVVMRALLRQATTLRTDLEAVI
jgi:hypothetical protein